MTLVDFSGSLSCNILPNAEGMICHETPYLSLSHPQLFFSPPAESFSQKSSTFLLHVAVHEERYRWCEGKVGAAIEREELLTLELECHRHYRSLGAGAAFSIALNGSDPGVLEDRRIEMHRLLGLMIEPQEWPDFLHLLPSLNAHCEFVGNSYHPIETTGWRILLRLPNSI